MPKFYVQSGSIQLIFAAADADWQRCRNLGINAVPTFIVENEAVVGAQPYEVLESLVVKGGMSPRQDVEKPPRAGN